MNDTSRSRNLLKVSIPVGKSQERTLSKICKSYLAHNTSIFGIFLISVLMTKKARMQCCCLEICVKWCYFYIVHIFQTERRSVTSRYHGSTFSRRQQNQRRRPTARRMAQKPMFILTNNKSARASRYFVHFFTVVAQLRPETS